MDFIIITNIEAVPIPEVDEVREFGTEALWVEAVPIVLMPVTSVKMGIKVEVLLGHSEDSSIIAHEVDGEEMVEASCEVVGEIVRDVEEILGDSVTESIATVLGGFLSESVAQSTAKSKVKSGGLCLYTACGVFTGGIAILFSWPWLFS